MIVDIVFVALVVILVIAIYRLKFKNDAAKIASTQVQDIRPQQQAQQRLMQENNVPRWAQRQQQQQQIQQQEEQSDDDNEESGSTPIADRRKQLRKQQKAKLKQQRKQALEHHLKEEKQRREKQEQEQQEKQRLQEEKRRKEEEYYRMLAEEEEKRKKAQYDKWKGMFKVETQGKAKESAQIQNMKKQQMLKSLLKSLQKNKLSLLEDLAHKFKLTTKELIQKIKQLEQRGDVKGIFDERGKYLVIQQKEWEAIRNYIEARGRIKKTDIMQECAKIIKIPDTQQIDEEMLSLIEKETQTAS